MCSGITSFTETLTYSESLLLLLFLSFPSSAFDTNIYSVDGSGCWYGAGFERPFSTCFPLPFYYFPPVYEIQAWKKAFGLKWGNSIRAAPEHTPVQICSADALIKGSHAVKKS